MPRHIHYVEPFAGGLAVLLERDPNDERLWMEGHKGVSEVVNDLNTDLTNFWRVLANPLMFSRMERTLQATPLSRIVFDQAGESAELVEGFFPDRIPDGIEPVARAVRFFIRCRQSRAGTFKGFTQLTRNRVRRGINGNASEWLGAVDGLREVHARLQPVVVENMDALKLIPKQDDAGTLFYCDPPYCHDTRTGSDDYSHEMSERQHRELLTILAHIKGKFILSGYRNELYDHAANIYGWNRRDYDRPNNAAGGKEKRRMVESLWLNY